MDSPFPPFPSFPSGAHRAEARRKQLRETLREALDKKISPASFPASSQASPQANKGLPNADFQADFLWNQGPKDEVEGDDIAKKMVGARTPWPVILQHSQHIGSPVSITETGLSAPDSDLGSHLLEMALQKSVERLAVETNESPQALRRRVLRRLGENRVSRKTVVSAVRFLRDAHGERWLELNENDV